MKTAESEEIGAKKGEGRAAGDDLVSLAGAVTFGVFVTAMVVLLAYYLAFRDQPIAKSTDAWGAFGDYFGGVVNPIVGVATVLLVTISITMQRRELRASLAELRRSNEGAMLQSFEQSLFSWLGNYHSLLDAIETSDSSGRRALQRWYWHFFSAAACAKSPIPDQRGQIKQLPQDEANKLLNDLRRSKHESQAGGTEIEECFHRALEGFKDMYRNNRSSLDAVFRTLYRLIRWIDKSQLSDEQRWHYVALVRGQLSWIEMAFLLYNGLTDDGKKFADVANRYALFDNLDTGSDAMVSIIAWDFSKQAPIMYERSLPQRPWPYKAEAFDSSLATAALGIPEDA